MTRENIVKQLVAGMFALLAMATLFFAALIVGTPVPPGYEKVEGYYPHSICLAAVPECGVCRGKVILGECYMKSPNSHN